MHCVLAGTAGRHRSAQGRGGAAAGCAGGPGEGGGQPPAEIDTVVSGGSAGKITRE